MSRPTGLVIQCWRCGDLCPVFENGVLCTDCMIYAYWTGERWKVYLPCWVVPHEWVSR